MYLVIYSFVCVIYSVLAGGISSDGDLENQIREALSRADSFVPKTQNTELLGVNLEENGKDYGTFDFIIVGSGASGAALANRLTEIKNTSVLMLEAGGDPKDEIFTIPYFGDLSTFTNHTWSYLTKPQKNGCLARNNRQCPYNLGKVLGGNTKTWYPINGRGNPKQFDSWASMGNAGWSYKEVLPYFKKLENFKVNQNAKHHGFSGPVPVDLIKPQIPIEVLATLSWEEEGKEITLDYTGSSINGAGKAQYLTENGKRKSAGDAYIHPILNRTNFELSLKSFVVKILTEPKTNAAIGVKFVKDGQVYSAKSRKEVLIAAGPINSVQLLWLSGIGPKENLVKLGIPVLANLPVGLFMKDYLVYDLYQTGDYTIKEINLKKLISKYSKGVGVLTTVHNYRYWASLDVVSKPATSVILLWAPPSGVPDPVLYFDNRNSSVKETSFDFTHTFRFSLLLVPESQGTVKLKSNSPVDFPEIDPNMFSKSEDFETLYKVVKLIETFLNTSIVRPYHPKILTAFPEENNHAFGTKEYWKKEFEVGAVPLTRAFGTTTMGPQTDLQSVVDSTLKVHNVSNLRVVGRGVLPLPLEFQVTIGYMIGEKAADIIKSEHALSN